MRESRGWKESPSLWSVSDEAAHTDAAPQRRLRQEQVPAPASSEASRVLVGLPMRVQEPRPEIRRRRRPGVTAAATTAVFATGEGSGVTAFATTAVFATGWPMTPTLPTRARLSGIVRLLRSQVLRRPRWRR